MIVIDASVLSPILLDNGAWGEGLRQRVEVETLHAPHLVDIEVAAALRRALRSGTADTARVAAALEDLSSFPLQRYPHTDLLHRIHELRDSVSSYDAAYVALAEALGTVLLTADARLGRAHGPTCPVEVVASL